MEPASGIQFSWGIARAHHNRILSVIVRQTFSLALGKQREARPDKTRY
jgi:hypothetical protein